MNKTSQTQSNDRNRINAAVARCCRGSKFAAAILILAACVLCAIQLPAQTVNFIGPKLRVTVPVGYNGMTIISNSMSYTTNNVLPDDTGTNYIIQPITVNLSGLPAGVTCVLTNMSSVTNAESITNATIFTATNLRTNSSSTVRLWVVFGFDGTTPEGSYTVSENATGGATNNLLLTLDVAHIWNGSTNAALDGPGYWSVPARWAANGTAGTNTDSVVVFQDWGGQTNSVYSNSTPPGVLFTNYLVNSIVDDNMTISSIRFAETNNTGYRFHTIKIADGKTLTVTGTNGFSLLRDYVNETAALATGQTVTFIGTNNAALVVTNNDANFSMLLDGQQAHLLDLSQLDNFRATVNRVALGDARQYPNFWNMDANNYGNHGSTSVPRRMLPTMALARTNVIKALFVGPDDYTNATTRDYAICFSRGAYGSTTTSGPPLWLLGLSNIFYADSICFNAYGSGNANMYCRFNSNFAFTNNSVNVTNNPIAIFRGTNGGRMTMFAISDAAGPGGETSSTKGVVDLGMNRGVVDALVDRVIIAADRPIIEGNGSGQPNHQGTFGFGAGTFDANTVILGYQTSGVHTNSTTNYRGYCQGNLWVSNTAVFKVNDSLILGYTTEASSINEVGPGAINNRGQVVVTRGGTMMVNRVTVGGVTKNSGLNTIGITNIGTGTNISTFILSNTIAGPDKMLDTLILSGGAVLAMHVSGFSNAPYIYTTNLSVSAGNFIRIEKLADVAYVGGVAQFPLIARFNAGTPTIPGVIMPAGFTGSGSVIPNGTLQWDLYVSTNPPNTNLVWRGPAGTTGTADWDTSSLYWRDTATGWMTNFHNGDWVTFDDTPGYATNVNEAVSILLPGQVTVSNAAIATYKFTGSGVQGGGLLTKRGAGTLEIAGSAAIPMTVAEGVLTNNVAGTIGGVTVAAGAGLGNAGTINGNINCSGLAYNMGTINGGLTVTSSGVVTNMAYIGGGTFTLQTNAFVYNGLNATMDNFGNSTIATNATLINEGYLGTPDINNNLQTVTVNGILKDTGASGTPTMCLQTLTIGGGGLFIPGGDSSTGVSSIRNPQGTAMGPTAFPGRVTLGIGSTNIMKVDPGAPTFTVLRSGALDFGPSQSSQQQNGSTLIITNVTGTPYTAGQYFKMFVRWDTGGNPYSTGTSTNCYPIIIPTTPGAGLIWDLSRLWATADFGYIGVAVPPVVHLTNSFSFPDGTNAVCSFSWPSTNQGWRLQTLVTPASVGLTPDTNFNWTGVAGSWTNISMVISNEVLGRPGTNVFFRLVFP
jgi:hypothetical protein